MRGLIVLFLLLSWSSPAFPAVQQGEPVRLAQHAAEVSESGGGGHALDSGPIDLDPATDESETGAGPCDRAKGLLAFYACQADALVSGSVQAIVLPLVALLLLL